MKTYEKKLSGPDLQAQLAKLDDLFGKKAQKEIRLDKKLAKKNKPPKFQPQEEPSILDMTEQMLRDRVWIPVARVYYIARQWCTQCHTASAYYTGTLIRHKNSKTGSLWEYERLPETLGYYKNLEEIVVKSPINDVSLCAQCLERISHHEVLKLTPEGSLTKDDINNGTKT